MSEDWPLTPDAWKALEDAVAKAADPAATAALAILRQRFPADDLVPVLVPAEDAAEDLDPDLDLEQVLASSGSVLLSESHEEAYLAYEAEEDVPAWQVVGDAEEVARATRDMGLDANALRPADLETEAMVIHPSAFCENGATFLGILALLNQRAVPFRLYRSLSRSNGSDQYLVRMFPEPGLETQDVLRAFHPGVARHVSELQERIHWAFEHLAQSIPDERGG